MVEQDETYREAIRQYGRDVARFVAGYERDAAKRQELLQEVHVALWQSCAAFRGQCSLRTWVYRVAHNVGTSSAT
jgi:RNA polymerase sigma-70 factor (ECF subfamily)